MINMKKNTHTNKTRTKQRHAMKQIKKLTKKWEKNKIN